MAGATGRPTTAGRALRSWIGGVAALALAACLAPSLEARALRILAAQGDADDDWIAAFEAEHDARVSVVVAPTDDAIRSTMKGSDGRDFELFAVNTAALQRSIDAGIAVRHELARIPNRPPTREAFCDLTKVSGTMRDGTVDGIAFGSIGLLGDTTKVDPPPESMTVRWDPRYRGKDLLDDASAQGQLHRNALSHDQSADEALQID